MFAIIGWIGVVAGIFFLFVIVFLPEYRTRVLDACAILSLLIGAVSLLASVSLTPKNSEDTSETITESDDSSQESNFVWLNELSPEEDDDNPGIVLYETVTDNLSNIYSHGFGGESSVYENVAVYNLQKQYESFRGKVILTFNSRAHKTQDTYVKIYGDDIVLWISPLISAGQEPVPFSLDEMSKIDKLKITIEGDAEIRLVDCALYYDSDSPTETTCIPYDPHWGQTASVATLETFNASEESGDSFTSLNEFTDNLGTKYTMAILGTNHYEENWETYYINQSFAEFKGYIALDYDYRSTTDEGIVKIYGDDTLLFSSDVITAGTEPQMFSIPVSSVSTITIVLPSDYIALVDAVLYKTAGDSMIETGIIQDLSPGNDKVPLTNLDFVAAHSSSGFLVHSIVKDNMGNVYADGLGASSEYKENWETYKLAFQYSRIEGKIVVDYNSRSDVTNDVYVKIYDGDTILYTSPLITAGVEPIEFSLDISYVDTLKISFIGRNDIVRLVDVYLYK